MFFQRQRGLQPLEVAIRNLSAGFYCGDTAGPGSLQAGSKYRVPAEGAGKGRSRPAGLPQLETFTEIKGKTFASS